MSTGEPWLATQSLELAAQELEDRLLFEQTVTSVARDFGELPPDADPLRLVQEEVECVAVTLGYDRCAFWQLEDDAAAALAWHDRRAADLAPLARVLTRDAAPWLYASLETTHGGTPPQSSGVRRTVVGIPARKHGEPSYVLHAECCDVKPASVMFLDARRLMLVCELIAAALHRARTARELRRLREAVTQADQAARLGYLAATVAHEVNQPLAAALCNAQAAARLLAPTTPDAAEARSAVGDVIAAVQRAGDVVQRMRALFQHGNPQRRTLSVTTLVGDVLDLARPGIESSGAVLVVELAEALPSVLGDAVQLQQLLLNLLTNARDAVAGPGLVVRQVVLRVACDAKGWIELNVEDTGVGLPEGDEDSVFLPFFTTKRSGFGMGLSICRQVATGHGGSIRAHRRPEGGSRFVVLLPPAARA